MTTHQVTTTTILAISGSLQSGSSNTSLVRLAGRLAGDRMHVDIFDALDALPYFNPELDVDPVAASVADLRARIGAADGVLICSPEYAHEMPGVLKNALDWLVSSGELYGKPVAVLCAAPSAERGTYVRQALEQTLQAEGAHVVVSATVAVTPAQRAGEPSAEIVQAVAAAMQALVA